VTNPLGQAHAFTPRHVRVDLPSGHRFPMAKYDRLAERLERDGWQLEPSPGVSWEALAAVHDPAYLDAVRHVTLDARAERRLGFPQSRALVARSVASTGGTVAALARALDRGLGVHLAGGTHHAFADRGEGFCVFNDLVVAARSLRARAPRVLVIDLDVHQGNGTAELAAGDPGLITYSVHGERNYPFQKSRSDLDRALPDGIDDDGYLAVVAADVPDLLGEHAPNAVLYQAGVDVLDGDRFGRMALSIDGVEARDRLVADACARRGIPLAYALGGGYHRDVEVTVEAHRRGLEAIVDAWRGPWSVAGGAASAPDVC
jgi:acetoin utilization deacetylase AcuC-like enzyme